MKPIEILAPAGDWDSVVAGVRCGANAIYLGGTRLNARKGASNFDLPLLKKTVSYCHARGVAVHLTLNTIVFDDELEQAALSIEEAAQAGVDALIVQDLAVAKLAATLAPTLALHASTQLSVHNLEGVNTLAQLGFSRAVVARELSLAELEHITKHSSIEIEAFVHGALCVSVSGQCYLSGMIGGRSGNRGRCAQPCRLPFASQHSTHALSLKDLSQIEYLPLYQEMGVASLKIEGRLKRPEYVAAAVTACVDKKNGRQPDYDTLQAVFSRSGFTDGYATGLRGENMFGTRRRQDVVSAKETFQRLQNLYHKETPLVPVTMEFTLMEATPATLQVQDQDGHTVTITGELPAAARTAPTDPGRAKAALEKTGGTPFYLESFSAQIQDGLFLPASGLNALRRQALEELLEERGRLLPHGFIPYQPWQPYYHCPVPATPSLRVRVSQLEQLTPSLLSQAAEVILPLSLWREDLPALIQQEKEKILLELPRVSFSHTQCLRSKVKEAKAAGFSQVLVPNLYGISLLEGLDLTLHGDFGLNTVNRLALETYDSLGFSSMTMSLEYGLLDGDARSPIPRGIVAYGWLPLMMYREHPAGMEGKDGLLTDRKDVSFCVKREGEVSVLYNSVPLSLADRTDQWKGLDFITLYFTKETPDQCLQVLEEFASEKMPEAFTRGMYQPRVL